MSELDRILVTNDDGIAAEGLGMLEGIAHELAKDVWTVAPEREQSGAGHSLSLHVPVRVRKLDERHYAASGTPTDCVLLALQQIIKQRPKKKPVDLVLSGINRGSNVGDDVTYSGTIAAAMEGAMLGVPSIALSQFFEDEKRIPWETPKKLAAPLIKKLVKAGWPKNTLMNINFPDCAPGKVKGIRVCPHGKRIISVALFERIDPKGRPYFWIGGERDNRPDKAGVDIDLLNNGYVTVTPLQLDLTDYKTIENLRSVCE